MASAVFMSSGTSGYWLGLTWYTVICSACWGSMPALTQKPSASSLVQLLTKCATACAHAWHPGSDRTSAQSASRLPSQLLPVACAGCPTAGRGHNPAVTRATHAETRAQGARAIGRAHAGAVMARGGALLSRRQDTMELAGSSDHGRQRGPNWMLLPGHLPLAVAEARSCTVPAF